MDGRRWRALAALTLALVLLPLSAFAQQRLTNFSVVEVERINQVYFRESKRAKEYLAFRDLVKQELKTMDAEIEELKLKRLESGRANNTDESNRIDRQIGSKQAERDTYLKLQEQKRLKMLDDLLSNDRYYRDLTAAIEWVCHQEGYAGAFNLSETPLLWWDPDIDITDKVIARMGAQ
jgi:Skp family chaperone for outer membrane proteins